MSFFVVVAIRRHHQWGAAEFQALSGAGFTDEQADLACKTLAPLMHARSGGLCDLYLRDAGNQIWPSERGRWVWTEERNAATRWPSAASALEAAAEQFRAPCLFSVAVAREGDDGGLHFAEPVQGTLGWRFFGPRDHDCEGARSLLDRTASAVQKALDRVRRIFGREDDGP